MSVNDKNLSEEVYCFLSSIPEGKVVTYGQIAERLGNKHLCRAVGNILHKNPDPVKYPCYKVVNSKGKLAENFGYGGIEMQKKRLEDDGITVVEYSVDLEKYKWKTEASSLDEKNS